MHSKNIHYYITMIFIILLGGCETYKKDGQQIKKRQVALEHQSDEGVFATSYEVYFDSNSARLDKETEEIMDNIAVLIKKSKPLLVRISGHADKFGDPRYNKTLSRKRARAVAQALKSRGVNDSLILIRSYGEDEPRVPTKDNVKILENRRVIIELKK